MAGFIFLRLRMNQFRPALVLGGLAIVASGLSSCLKAPEYSTTPEISFDSIRLQRSNFPDPKQQPIDSLSVTIRFQDGDGDLGLDQAERRAAKDSVNYYIEPYVKNTRTGKYEPLTVVGVPYGSYTAGQYNGTFDHPSVLTDNKAAPIKGTLKRTIDFGYGDVFTAGQTIRFDVSIADRARHISNTIRTDSVVVAKR